MNEFLSCTKKNKSVEEYHEEFVKLSRHAPLMSEEQKLSIFILGLGGMLTDKVESLRPASIADALIQAKSKMNSFAEGRKRNPPSYPFTYKPTKAPFVPALETSQASYPLPPIAANHVSITGKDKEQAQRRNPKRFQNRY